MRARGGLLLGCVLAVAGHAEDAGIGQALSDLCAWRANRVAAYTSLEAAGPKAFPAVLTALLGDQSERVKVQLTTLLVGYATAMDSTEPYVDDLRRLLRGKDPSTVGPLWPAFAKAGPSIIPTLQGLFAAPDAEVRAGAARALGTLGPQTFPFLRKSLGGASAFRIEAALIAIAAAGDTAKEFTREVVPFLAHEKPGIRCAAAMAYGAINPDRREAARAVLPLLDDPDPRVSDAAASALGSHAAERMPALVAALAEADRERRDRLVAILRKLSATDAPAFASALPSAPLAARYALLDAMAPDVVAALPPETCDRIAAWARDPDPSVRVPALGAIGGGGWPDRAQAVQLLREAFGAQETAVRAGAMPGLVLLDERSDLLKAGCADQDPVVRMEAACALFLRGEEGPDPLPLCIELVDRVPSAARRIGEMGARGLPAVPDLVRAVPRATCGEAARWALEQVLASPPADAIVGRPAAFAAAPQEIRASADKALQWLAAAQEVDGRWDGTRWGGQPLCDTGVTALALLAFLSAGHTDTAGPHAATVGKALRFLVASQADDGCVGTRATRTFAIQHAIATTALAEATPVCRDPSVRAAAEHALVFVSLCRNPKSAWRYDPRGGESDTYVTAWMVTALKAGEMAALHRDPAAYEGARSWIDRMTEPNFGQVGYNVPGGDCASPKSFGAMESTTPAPLPLSPIRVWRDPETERRIREYERAKAARGHLGRNTQSCTAAGLWIRLLCGSDFRDPVEQKGHDLMGEQLPRWNPDEWTIDECYWHWGALVTAQSKRLPRREPVSTRWRHALEGVLLSRQASDGSWDPLGVWGQTGGRVFSTAMAALALLAPYAYPEGCFRPNYRRTLYSEAYRVLGR